MLKREKYYVRVVPDTKGGKTIAIKGLVGGRELKIIKNKIGDVNKYPIGKSFVISIWN